MGYMNEFPHSRMFDSDLREILEMFEAVYGLPKTWDAFKKEMEENWNNIKTFVEKLDISDEVNKKLDEMADNGELTAIIAEYLQFYVTPQMFGAVGDGVTDDTEAFQNAIDSQNPIYIPKGIYKITQLNLLANTVIYGSGRYNSVIDSDVEDYCIVIPRSANCVHISDLKLTSGIDIGHSGTASVQDMNTRITDVTISGGKGLYIGHRGGVYTRVTVGGAVEGIRIDGTDNLVTDSTVASVQGHGFIIINANNALISCKAFCCGLDRTTRGNGFAIAGAFCRLVNCEAQQNSFENFYFINSHGTIVDGCISDGAWWRSDHDATYENDSFGTIPRFSIFLHNCNSMSLDISVINGSIFDGVASVSAYAFGGAHSLSNADSRISVTVYNRNGYTCDITNKSLAEYNQYNIIVENPKLFFEPITPSVYRVNGVDIAEVISGGYIVQNGICTLTLELKILTSYEWVNPYAYAPKPLTSYAPVIIYGAADYYGGINSKGEIVLGSSIPVDTILFISSTYIVGEKKG